MTENYHPRWTFFIYSFWGLIISVIGAHLNEECEVDPEVKEQEEENEPKTCG